MNKPLLFIVCILLYPLISGAENGYELWLRYKPLPESQAIQYKKQFTAVTTTSESPILLAAQTEIIRAIKGLTGSEIPRTEKIRPGSLVLGTHLERLFPDYISNEEILHSAEEGFFIRTIPVKGGQVTVITGHKDAGVLYGTFALIRMMQTGQDLTHPDIQEKPAYQLRLLNHWDNLNGSVERGYAGLSLWWNRNEDSLFIRNQYLDYARANASIGINGAVLNNVNASPLALKDENIRKLATIADIFRPYHIRVYMSVNFSSPAILGGLPDSDPLNPSVIGWWKNKVDEIYNLIPDFGGFLVKANSEGQPGPQKYGRTHADGANMLAEVLKPYQGVVMWRAFVYEPSSEDRARQAYNEFVPLDGKFADNVIIQVKNGPVDFQPREPFSPLFGAMPKTALMVEFQITQEYLGWSDHLVYLAPLQKECLNSDTWCQGQGSTVARITDGTLYPDKISAIAGVANTGRDTAWCGHHFAQANWYAFGRLSWNHQLTPKEIALEWLRMTFNSDSRFTGPATDIMMRSRETTVRYMTPLGLHHIMGWSHHHGPEPWTNIRNARPDWLPRYYHNATPEGIGFNRTTTGSKAVEQYFSPLREMYNQPETCPQNLLLWFHHLPWNYSLTSGRSLWEELCYEYYAGVEEVRDFQRKWDELEIYVDPQRFHEVQYKLKIQTKEAIWWRDACLLYFQTFSKMKIPPELERPIHDLEDLFKKNVP